MTAEQLPALPVVVPLVAAPLCALLGRRALALPLALGVVWSTFGLAVALLLRVREAGTLSYAMGGWAAPAGIELRVDLLSAFVVLLVSGLAAVTLTWSPASVAREIPESKQALFFAAFLLCLTGLLGIAVTGDLFNVFVFLEVSSLSSYALIALGNDRRALVASYQYLVLGTIGATFYLIGVGLMYMMTGTLNMVDMAERLGPVGETRTLLAAFAFITVGIALKMALFPLHAWLPNAYTFAPSTVTAFLAATATKVSVYLLLRLVFTVFGPHAYPEVLRLDALLIPLALVGIFVASIVAVFQRNVKRILAYSSVAQIGYMVLGIGLLTVSGVTAGIVHMFNHALLKGALFLALGAMVLRTGSPQLDDLNGIGRRMPVTTFAWLLAGLGLIGMPLTAGFVSKFLLIAAALEGGFWPVAALVLISSLIALVYVWRVVEVAYFRDPPDDAAPLREAPPAMQVGIWLLIAAIVWFGISTEWSAGIAREAAELLLSGLR